MSRRIRVYCMVIILLILFAVFMHFFVKLSERLINFIFADHNKQMALISENNDKNFTMSSVDCLDEIYIREWIQSSASDIKCGDSVFVYLIQDDICRELLSEPGLFRCKRRKAKCLIVNLAVRNHYSYEFERIHSITCNSISPELVSLAYQGMWFSYDMSLVD